MKQHRIVALSMALGLSLPVAAFAQTAWYPQSVEISQNLPPMQSGGYNQGYDNSYGGNGSFTPYGQPQQQTYQQQPYQQQQAPLQGYVVTAPPGTTVTATVSQPVSSEFARVGDRVTLMLSSPVTAGNSVVLPVGTQVEGQVMMAERAGRTGKHGELDIRFNSAMLPNGQRMPISARIQTEDGTGIIKGGSTKGRVGRAALNTGVGAAAGAALGTAMGPLSGGEVGKGAIYGTILGGGLGALKAGWNKGEEAQIQSGEPVNIVLDQPLTASPVNGGNSGYTQQQVPNSQYYQQQPPAYPQNPQPYNFYGN